MWKLTYLILRGFAHKPIRVCQGLLSPRLAQIVIQVRYIQFDEVSTRDRKTQRYKMANASVPRLQVLMSHFIVACFTESFLFAENRCRAKIDCLSLLKAYNNK